MLEYSKSEGVVVNRIQGEFSYPEACNLSCDVLVGYYRWNMRNVFTRRSTVADNREKILAQN